MAAFGRCRPKADIAAERLLIDNQYVVIQRRCSLVEIAEFPEGGNQEFIKHLIRFSFPVHPANVKPSHFLAVEVLAQHHYIELCK